MNGNNKHLAVILNDRRQSVAIIGKKYNIVTKEISYLLEIWFQARLKSIPLSRQIICEINLHSDLIYEDIVWIGEEWRMRVRACTCVLGRVERVRTLAISIRLKERSFFSATSRTSCARSLFFTADDFQTPHPYRTLSSGFMMKKHLGTAHITFSLEDIPHVARHVFAHSYLSLPAAQLLKFRPKSKIDSGRYS